MLAFGSKFILSTSQKFYPFFNFAATVFYVLNYGLAPLPLNFCACGRKTWRKKWRARLHIVGPHI